MWNWEIRKDDGNTIMVVQRQGNTRARFSAGQRIVLASNGNGLLSLPRKQAFTCGHMATRMPLTSIVSANSIMLCSSLATSLIKLNLL